MHQEGAEPIAVKVFETEKVDKEHQLAFGDIVTDNKTYLHVAVQGGFIAVKSLQLAGKKRLGTDEFLRGFKLAEPARFC